jgi:hypothetical protein
MAGTKGYGDFSNNNNDLYLETLGDFIHPSRPIFNISYDLPNYQGGIKY